MRAAIERVEAPARAAWLAKWAIMIMFVPGIGLLVHMMVWMVRDLGPPKGAFGVVMTLTAMLGAFAATCIFLAIPMGVWAGIVVLLRFVLGRLVDRRARALRVALDLAPRPSQRRALRDATRRLGEAYERAYTFLKKTSTRIGAVVVLLLVEIAVDVVGTDRSVDFGSLLEFFRSFLILVMMNFIILGMAIVPTYFCVGALGWVFRYFKRPPSLLHFEAQPAVINEALLARWTEGRDVIAGRAEPLTEAERLALAGLGGRDGEHERAELEAPFSRARCLAFRVTGESGTQPLDDADAVPFTVVGEDGRRCVVFTADVVVVTPARGEVYRVGGKGFLEARGLYQGELAAREGRIEVGERVRVAGRIERVAVAGGGYRQHGSLELLVAGDGSPVVIEEIVAG